MPTSIFSDEWRECLIAHYTTIARMGDQRTERTLHGVMINAGFSEADLRQFYLAATAHVDDVGGDFVPDPEIVEPVMVAVAPLPEQPVEDLLDGLDDSSELLALAEEALPEAVLDASELESELADETSIEQSDDEADDPSPPSNPDVTQLSLF